MKLKALLILSGFLGFLAGGAAQADDYPDKPITLVVPTAPGGGQDTLSRLIANKFGEILHTTIVVENRAGAGGSVGAQYVAQSAPDGYTLLMTTMNNAANMSLIRNLNYSLTADLTGVTELVKSPFILCVNPNVPAKSFQEFVKLAKSEPGKLNYGSSGVGGSSHLGMELLKTETGMDVVHIPLDGSGPSVTELLAGRIDVTMLQAAVVEPLVKDGKVRALAVTSAKRSSLTPDIPSIAELGVSNYDVAVWYGITVPSKTPKEIIEKLHNALLQTMADPDTKKKIVGLGFDVVGAGPDDFNTLIASDVKRWGEVIKAAGVQPE
jgi:tripartite-type tricarboxylate transporter receptor subunit TctC